MDFLPSWDNNMGPVFWISVAVLVAAGVLGILATIGGAKLSDSQYCNYDEFCLCDKCRCGHGRNYDRCPDCRH